MEYLFKSIISLREQQQQLQKGDNCGYPLHIVI